MKLSLLLLCAYFVFAAGCASNSNKSEKPPSVRTQTEKPSTEKEHVSVLETLNEDMKTWPDRFWTDSRATFTRPDNITALLLAGGASIALHQDADEDMADYFDKHGFLHEWPDESLNIIGHPTTHLIASSLWYSLSVYNQDSLNKERAWTMRTALSISWLSMWGLKLARHNETPNGKDWAWPSGHASSSFTAASVLDEFYGHKVGIPAYALASLVSYRMMDTSDNWGSDIVFGATLGWVVGHSVARQNKDLTFAGYTVVPFTAQTETQEPAMGIGLMKRF